MSRSQTRELKKTRRRKALRASYGHPTKNSCGAEGMKYVPINKKNLNARKLKLYAALNIDTEVTVQ